MAEIINLNRARKRQKAAQDEAKATVNRVVHGRTKAERQRAEAEATRTRLRLDGHQRTPDADPD